MSRKNDIIEALYLSKEINEAINKMDPEDLRGDLKSEVFMVLFKMDEARLIDMYDRGVLIWFAIRTMLNMIKSNKSTFYKNYRNLFSILNSKEASKDWDDTDGKTPFYKKAIPENIDSPDFEINMNILSCFGNSNSELYVRDMFLLYTFTFNRNARELSRSTKIPYQTVIWTIKNARIKLKKHLKCLQQS